MPTQTNVVLQNRIAPFLRCHGSLFSFDEHECAVLESCAAHSHSHEPGTYIRRQSDSHDRPYIVASGWACYARAVHNGRRQIFGFILPGDSIGLADSPYIRGGSEIVALTTVALLDAAAIKLALTDSNCPNLRAAIDSEHRLQEARLLDHMFWLGQHSSLERTAHLLLELHHRLHRAGLVKNEKFQLPLTQTQMGHALGLSLVHINRTMQALRRAGLLVLDDRQASLPNLHELERITGLASEQQTSHVTEDSAVIDSIVAQDWPYTQHHAE